MSHRFLSFIITFCVAGATLTLRAADPTSTHYTYNQCQGTAMPYPEPSASTVVPDSLTPVMINHVGRHGARYLTSDKRIKRLEKALAEADSARTITAEGKALRSLLANIKVAGKGRWGALDSLGMAEQRGIAKRMFKAYPTLFGNDAKIVARSSRVPRCVNSMFTFLYQLSRLNSRLDIDTYSGPQESPLLRFFETNQAYIDFCDSDAPKQTLKQFEQTTVPLSPLMRVLGKTFAVEPERAQSLAMDFYKVIAGMQAMGMSVDIKRWFTLDEFNALWAVDNLDEYLYHSVSTLSTAPADDAAALLQNIIDTTQDAVDASKSGKPLAANVILRFGHAETLAPLLSLMRLPGAYYLTNYFDTVAQHWRSFDIVPMAANLQIVLFKTKAGRYYARIEHNEVPVALDPMQPERTIIPWSELSERLQRCVPIYSFAE